MRTYVKATFEDGDYFCTGINLTPEEACEYYLGKVFNTSGTKDNMQRCVRVDILDTE